MPIIGLGTATAVAVAVFFVARWVLVEAFAAWNRWQFSLRPEIENWALPYLGTQTPATMWAAAIATSLFVAGGLLVRRARRRHESGVAVS